MAPKRKDERVLVLAPVGQDASAMATSLKGHGVQVQICRSPVECVRYVTEGSAVLVLTEEALELPEISGLFETLKVQPPWSELPLIVLTSGGESRRSRLLETVASAAGGFTLLERPMSAATLWRSVQVALQSRRRQYLVRDLVEARSKLAAIVESSEDAIISKDLNGIITSWNQGSEKLFGYKASEAVGRSVLMLIPLDRHDEEAEILGRIRVGKSVEHYETVRQRKDGSHVQISLTVSPMRDDRGKVIGASKIARDITERKLADAERLRRVRQQQQLYELAEALNRPGEFETVYQAALDAIEICLNAPRASILLMEPDGVMRFKAWRGLSDEYRQAAEGHSPWPSTAEDAEPVCISDATGGPLDKGLRRVIRREGIRALAFIPLVYLGKLLGKFMVYYDAPHTFTEEEIQLAETIANQLAFGVARKRNEDALRSASYRLANQTKDLGRLVDERTVELTRTNKQLEAFVYSVAHDLRGPLRSMQSFSELLLDERALTDTGRDFAGRINKSAQFMDRLLTDLLSVSRLSQKQVELTDVELEPMIRSVLGVMQPKIEETGAKVELAGSWPVVRADKSTLTQVFMNLLDNALKFVPVEATPLVRLWAEEREDTVRVWVEDNGIGIPAEYRDQIFRLFSRLHGGIYPGTGIGLAIVQRGMERIGGKVGVESGEEKGSRFWFEIARSPSGPSDT